MNILFFLGLIAFILVMLHIIKNTGDDGDDDNFNSNLPTGGSYMI